MKMQGCKNEPLRSRLELACKLIAVLGVTAQELDNFAWLQAIDAWRKDQQPGDDLGEAIAADFNDAIDESDRFVRDKYGDLSELAARLGVI